MDNGIVLSSIKSGLHVFSNKSVFNSRDNMVISQGVEGSRAYYFQGGRFSERLIVVFNRAAGEYHDFLNGVTIYGSDGKGGVIFLADYITPMYCGWYWCEENARRMAKLAISKYIENNCHIEEIHPSESEIDSISDQLYSETCSMTAQMGNYLHEQLIIRHIA